MRMNLGVLEDGTDSPATLKQLQDLRKGTVIKKHRPLPRVVNVNDLLTLAQRRLPKAVFDYVDGGSEDEFTLRQKCEAFKQVTFRPKQAVSVGDSELSTQVLQTDLAFPAMLAPIGYSRLMHTGGEVAVARAAGNAGIGYILSTISTTQDGGCQSGDIGSGMVPTIFVGRPRSRRRGY